MPQKAKSVFGRKVDDVNGTSNWYLHTSDATNIEIARMISLVIGKDVASAAEKATIAPATVTLDHQTASVAKSLLFDSYLCILEARGP